MPHIRSKMLLSLTLLATVFANGSTVIARDTTPANRTSSPFAEPTGRLIIKYRIDEDTSSGLAALQGNEKRTDSTDRRRWRKTKGLKLARKISREKELVSASSGSDVTALHQQAQIIASSHEVVSASVEYRRYALAQPNDPLYRDSTNPGNQFYMYEGDFSMRAPGAWDITTGSSTSVIAIVDTGALPNHPDLQDRGITGLGYDFVSAEGPADFTAANDGDGRDADPTDPGDHCNSNTSSWHGTGVASVAAGNSNNAEGIAGVDWNARLLHARALGRCGGTDADIIDAIRWSAGLNVAGIPINTTPATVVNLSIGGPTECTPAWQDVIDELNELGIPFVIAAGNESNNALRSSPANCSDVITVGSSTPGGSIDSGFSNYGLKVTIAAPGRDIVMATNNGALKSDENDHSYQLETGSSFSAALVSGAISLMQSVNSDLSPTQVRSLLQNSASDFATDGECSTYYCGSGILNLSRALSMARDGNFDGSGNTEKQVINNQLSSLSLSQTASGNLFGRRDIRYFQIDTLETGMLIVNSDSSADLYGYLLNDNLSVLALDDDTGDGLNFRVASRVPAGTYYLAVERAIHRSNDGETTFNLNAELSTVQPASFSFPAVVNSAVNSPVLSESVVLSGMVAPAVISVSGGYYSVNDGPLTAAQGTVNSGDSIYVSLQSASAINTEKRLSLSVGAFGTDFSVTTGNDTKVPPIEPVVNNNGSSGCTLITPLAATFAAGTLDPTLLLLLLFATLGLGRTHLIKQRSNLQS